MNSAPNPMNSVYVGNIAWRTTEQEIGDTFANFGYVSSVKIITDKETGRSKGFGFVEFQDNSILPMVIQQMNGYNLNGRQLRVNMASGTNNNQNRQNQNQQGGPGGMQQGGPGGHMQQGGAPPMQQGGAPMQAGMGMGQQQFAGQQFQQQQQPMGGFQNQGF